MARIDSLNVLLSTTGNDYLEQYGDNIQKATISGTIKNRHFRAIRQQVQLRQRGLKIADATGWRQVFSRSYSY